MSAFETFYAAYPRHEARKDALKAWGQVDGDRHAAAILAALEWQRDSDQWRRGYVPLAASYLRGERWTDENPTVAVAARHAEDRQRQRDWMADRNARPDMAAEREQHFLDAQARRKQG